MAKEPGRERISADEAAYLEDIWAKREVADAAAVLAKFVTDSFWAHLAKKYDLTPDDEINREGVIARKAAAPPKED